MGNQWLIASRSELRHQQRYDLGPTNRTADIIRDLHYLGQQLRWIIVCNDQHHNLGRDCKHQLQSLGCHHCPWIRHGQHIRHKDRWHRGYMGNFTFASNRSVLRQWYDLWSTIGQHEFNNLHCLCQQFRWIGVDEFDIDHQRANTEHRLQPG